MSHINGKNNDAQAHHITRGVRTPKKQFSESRSYRSHESAAQGSRSVFFFSELRIQFSAGQFWQRNRGNIGISPQPLVGSARRGRRTKGLDPARRGMPYLPLTEFFCPFNDHSPPAIRRGDLLASSRPFPKVVL